MHLLNKLICILLLLILSPAHGKQTDQAEPINIEADSVEIREQQGISIYRGNVKITKGSMLIKGDLIHIHSKQQGLEKILVEGRPATFKQLNDLDEEISAQSMSMTYQAESGMLELNEEAILVQSKNKFTSDHIVYDTQRDIVQAGKQDETSDESEPTRVMITIHPEENQQPKNTKQ